ncbi:MAG TPA: ABC transporter permease [Bryobacteraceae bacterium]|nr:ABC transporter permease [Bryobacteraceae bacterium]
MKLRRVRAMARKEFLHIVRDKRSLVMALLVPLFMLVLFGYALSLDVDHIPTLIVDHDGTPASRDLRARFSGTPYFDVRGVETSTALVNREIDRGATLLAVVIPAGFHRGLERGERPGVQLLLDGSDSNTASIAINYAQALITVWAAERTAERLDRTAGMRGAAPAEAQVRVWYNSDLRSRNYLIPGLIAVVLMIIAALLTSLTIAREWENGSMEQLLSTPLRPAEIVLGKLAAYFAVGAVDVLTSVLMGIFVFEVPLRGSLLFLALASGIFLFGALSWGILISAIAKTQLLAYQMGMLSSFLPAFLLSGFMYSIENMPRGIQIVSYIVPARYFIAVLKAVYLKGEGMGLLWAQILFLTLYAAVVFLLATRKVGHKVA